MYNIGNAFKQIEDDLIGSMIRNLDHHRAEELKEGFNWSQWQVEQLAALDEYKKRNLKKYKGVFGDINNRIDEIIAMQRQAGKASQEISILKAMKEGAKLHKAKKGAGMDGRFFKTNDRKLNALVKATKNDFKKAEYAMLRMSKDRYRQVIFNAQVYANMGAGTYEKAVDMATKDFLRAGINCVEYKNGSRHTVEDYTDMAIRTAGKRAYLTGEGEKRKEWGISTVIMNKRGNPCAKCLPFVGKVLIDDVWSGGKQEDGPYQLMSEAIAQGLYHPRCKDSHTTYFPELDNGDDTPTKEEKKEVIDNYNQEQKANYCKTEANKLDRMAKYSLDPDNKKMYQARADEYRNGFDYMSNGFRPQYSSEESLIVNDIKLTVKKVKNSNFDMVTDIGNGKRNKAVRLSETQLVKIKKSLTKKMDFPKIAVVDFDNHKISASAIGGYDSKSGVLYINSKYDTKIKIIEYVTRQKGYFANKTESAPFLHELGHKYYYDSIKSIAKFQNIGYSEAKKRIDYAVYKYLDNYEKKFLTRNVSVYADTQEVSEICAECFSIYGNNIYATEIIDLIEEIVRYDA